MNIDYNKNTIINHSKNIKDLVIRVRTNTIEEHGRMVLRKVLFHEIEIKEIALYLKKYQWRKKSREYDIWRKFLKD